MSQVENALEYKIVIAEPSEFIVELKAQMLHLVVTGGQVKEDLAKTGIYRAMLVGIVLLDDRVISTCCLKVPFKNYRKNIFTLAKSSAEATHYTYELGYIATHPDHEGRGLCQKLLNEFFPRVSGYKMFATTRKDAMEHVLGKYLFNRSGNVFKDDLKLMLYEGNNNDNKVTTLR